MNNLRGNGDHIYTYTGNDLQKIITEIVIDYFNGLGHLILKVRSEGRYVTTEECDHNYARSMLKTGIFNERLFGEFNCGPSSDVAKLLFNQTSMKYYEYIFHIFQELRNSYEEPPIFTTEYPVKENKLRLVK